MADLSNIKVGDYVTIEDSYGNPYLIVAVVKVNKASFNTLKGTYKFNGDSKIGDAWHRTRCHLTTQADRDYIRIANKRIRLVNYLESERKNFTEEQIDGIATLLNIDLTKRIDNK